MSIAEDIANIMSAELALHVQALGAITDPKKRFKQFQHLSRELSRLRRDDQRAMRTNDRRDHWRYDHPQRNSPQTPEPEYRNENPNAGGASVLASRPDVNSPKPYIPSIEDLKRLRDAAIFHQGAPPPTPQPTHLPVPSSAKPETMPDPKRQRAGALQDAPRISEASTPRASVPECGSPLSAVASAKADLPLSQSEPKRETAAKKAPCNPPLPDLSTINHQLSTPPPILPNPTNSQHNIFCGSARSRPSRCVED
jgi:hypothetical protein